MSSKTKAPAAKEDSKPTLVPKLRFPEFRDAEGWNVKKIANVVELVSGMHLSPEQYGKVGADPYFTGPSDFTNTVESITKRTSDSASLAKQDDTLITVKGSGVGEIWYLTLSSVAIGRQLMAIRAIDAVSGFVFQFLLTKRQRFGDLAAGNLIPGLSRGDILDLETPFPKLPEQQKIAECLSSVDELIAAQARKLDALKIHKKGLMQQLFPREGETQPRLRFPEFQNAGDWEPKRLEDITDSIFDGTHQTPTYTSKGVPFYSVENLISGNANKFISRDDYLIATRKNRPEKGDVLITRIGKIGYSEVVTWDHEFSVYVTLAVIKQSKVFNAHFLSYFMQSDFYQTELRAKSLPNAVPPKINLDSLRATGVLLTNEDEQKRIAACFTTLDDLIAAQTQKLKALKTHKKGLMQQLFPSPDSES